MNICKKLTEEEYREYLNQDRFDYTDSEIEVIIDRLKKRKAWGKNGR